MFNLLKMLLETKNKKEKQEGTYVGAKFSEETENNLKKFMTDINVPKPLAAKDFHTTIIFSRKKFPNTFKPLGKIKDGWKATPTSLDIFTGRNGQNCLVLKYTCDDQKKRHEYLMEKYKATYDWPEYKLHLTLSYDCGDFDVKAIKVKDYIQELTIDKEYEEDLQLDWLANKDKK